MGPNLRANNKIGMIQTLRYELVNMSKPYHLFLKSAGLTCARREYVKGLKRASPAFLEAHPDVAALRG
jgi:hypothetical protein